jgi:hypothetical protein
MFLVLNQILAMFHIQNIVKFGFRLFEVGHLFCHRLWTLYL